LFGHEKGAFSGAHATKKGLLEIAESGTVLLDEIGEMGFHLQAKLLGVLDEMQIRRIGGVISHPLQTRIMAATNVPLDQKIQAKEFREDLYYRLNVIRIHLPPLRDRKEDIPRLAETFLRELAPQKKLLISQRDLDRMLAYDWPGNVRELRNVMEMAVIHSQRGNELHLPLLMSGEKEPPSVPLESPRDILTLEELQRRYSVEVLKKMNNNLTRTAKALGISLNTLKKKLSKPK
ncbi:MAG: sigma-54-dependent Fis family transcriptional regulator, partial [Candidatus Aminicenantes bacterium]|nr:sigma-54-dependent Fis family transcriptional regulator [Candidatus Aminicenantes bacterium]